MREVMNKCAWVLAVGAMASCVGCVGPIYNRSAMGAVANVSTYTTWTITGDLNNLRAAIDDNVATAATSNSYYTSAYFTIDLGRPCVFNTVIVDHGMNRDGYPRRMSAEISMDGRNFQYQYSVPGTRRVTIMNWVTPVMARYIRVRAVAPGNQPWSVAEVYVQ
jgi:hypothetical protein